MTRLTRDEMAIVHVMNRAVRRCFLMGYNEFSGRNDDYRKDWIVTGKRGSTPVDAPPILLLSAVNLRAGSRLWLTRKSQSAG